MMNEVCRTIPGGHRARMYSVALDVIRHLLDNHDFSLVKAGFQDGNYVIAVKKQDASCHVEGIEFRYEIELAPSDDSDLRVTVKQNDLRDLLKAHGVDWAVAWQILASSDAGAMVTSVFATEICDHIEDYVGDIMARSHA